jgi:hypothetical protein
VEPLIIVVKLDVFEGLTPGLGPAAEDLILWKTLCFQRAEECFHHRIIIAISYPTHALTSRNDTQGFAHRLTAVLAPSIGVKVQAGWRKTKAFLSAVTTSCASKLSPSFQPTTLRLNRSKITAR